MFPFASHGYYDFVMDKELAQEPRKNSGREKKKEHEIVLLPVSPRHSTGSSIHLLIKSRLAWLICILVVILLVLLYQAYEEHLKQLRLIGYLERVDELKLSMDSVQHDIVAGRLKLQLLQQMYQHRNTSVVAPYS